MFLSKRFKKNVLNDIKILLNAIYTSQTPKNILGKKNWFEMGPLTVTLASNIISTGYYLQTGLDKEYDQFYSSPDNFTQAWN